MASKRTAVLAAVFFLLMPIAAFAGTGVLEVKSQPSGAHVIIDGVDVGTTPYQNIYMPTGKHRVKAVLGPDYAPLVQNVVINELAPQVILFKFVKQKQGSFVGHETVLTTEQLTGNVVFVSIPTGASVVIDGLPRKSTPIGYTDLEVGKYPVTFILGKRDLRSHFEVVQGETVKVIADFDKGKVFDTANEAKMRAAKRKASGLEMGETAVPSGPEEMLSPERAAAAPGMPETETEKELATAGTMTPEMAAPRMATAGTGTAGTTAPTMASTGTGTAGTTAPAMASTGTATTGGTVTAMLTPQPAVIPPPGTKQPAVSGEVPSPPEGWTSPFGQLEITVNVRREAGLKYSDYFILSFPKIPIGSISGELFPKASTYDESVSKDNFKYLNDAYIESRWFTARINFGPKMTSLADKGAQSDVMTVKKGTYDLKVIRRRIVKHFVPDDKILDKSAQEQLEIVPGKRLLVQIDGEIGKENNVSYEITKTYEPIGKKKTVRTVEQQAPSKTQEQQTSLKPEKQQANPPSRNYSAGSGAPSSSSSPLSLLHGGQD